MLSSPRRAARSHPRARPARLVPRPAATACLAAILGLALAGCGGASQENATPRAAVLAYSAAVARGDAAAACRLLQPVAWSALTGGDSSISCPRALQSSDGRYQLRFYRLSPAQIGQAKLTIYDAGRLAVLRTPGVSPRVYALRHTSRGWLIDSP